MKKEKTFPVFDICSLEHVSKVHSDIVAEPFAPYLKSHPDLHFPHRHSFYHIVLFTKGQGTQTIDFEQFPVQDRQVYFMIPGQVHGWNFGGQVDGYVVNFSENLFRSFLLNQQYPEQFHFLQGIAKDSVINLDTETASAVCKIMEQIVEEMKERKPYNTDMVCSLLMSLFIIVSRSNKQNIQAQPLQQNALILHNFRKLVEQYYAEKRLPKEYAAMLYITPNHLNALCNDMLGKAPGEIIRDRALLEAKRLLVNADISIAEIADQLNFADNSYFSKFFKKYTGVTPEEFRKSPLSTISNS